MFPGSTLTGFIVISSSSPVGRLARNILRNVLGAKAQIVNERADDPADNGEITDPLQRAFPDKNCKWNVWVHGQAIELWLVAMSKNRYHAGPADAGRIVNRGLRKTARLKLLDARLGLEQKGILRSEGQAACRTCLDARRLQAHGNAVHAQGALVYLLRVRAQLRNIKWTAGDAITATRAIVLLEVDYAVVVLNNGAGRRTRLQASGISTMHALVLAEQPVERAIIAFVFVELDEVPEVRRGFGQRLVGTDLNRCLRRKIVPFLTRNLASLAANTCAGVD